MSKERVEEVTIEEEAVDVIDVTTIPEKKTFWETTKTIGCAIGRGVKKALPYVGCALAGAGAAVGAIAVLARPDGSELEALPMDEEVVPVDEFIEGEVVDAKE